MDTLRALATDPAARDLIDDAAVLEMGEGALVLTHDMIVESVHYLPTDPPEDVAWKLVAVNLSDLAAKGARPMGALLGYTLGDSEWDAAFAKGLGLALSSFGLNLLGGDTTAMPSGTPRALGMTAIGMAAGPVPARAGARPGDQLWVTGTIGDAGAGLAIARGAVGPAALLARYRRPTPRLAEGRALAAQVNAMMDVSDGLFLDARRMAAASGCAVTIDLAFIPLSHEYRAWSGDRLAAATAGDDYELLFVLPPDAEPPVPATRIGCFAAGAGLSLANEDAPVPLPERLGFEHG